MLTYGFYWFLLLCEAAAVIFLLIGLISKVRQIVERY